ncbi:hypothetical protein GLW08_20480 [Pontibacillus yanchengensis]|uniref:Uncharacterized protein n=2 Tax=Pontibacillus yanchengensis TaxID=462910 RepID=A0ACC7VLL2_9BACI|nr:ATPase, T2SS/T4P/T4SS family [Pontibacillus yanchengensis]MYL35482.1 hypothetical protein [Pontibacillus yanchengensis]MYL55682.1 hypothetical protein [Pontibacillus yanchengensis]
MTNSVIEKEHYVSPDQRRALDIKNQLNSQTTINDDEFSSTSAVYDAFYSLCDQAKDYVYEVYDEKVQQNKEGNSQENYVGIYHNAMRGVPEHVNMIKKTIENYISNSGKKDIVHPPYYLNLVEAVFEEEFGWGPLAFFKYEKESEGAQAIGKDIKIKRNWGWELQSFGFRSEERVFKVADRFANMYPDTQLNAYSKPEVETRTFDNYRISIMIPYRMHREPKITIRRKKVQDYKFEVQANYGTIPSESIPLFQNLSHLLCNGILAGPPGCGKSTMLQTIMGEFLYTNRQGKLTPEPLNTMYSEVVAEFDPRSQFPNTFCDHIIGEGEEFEKDIPKAMLRHDIHRVVCGEIREHEAGLYRRSSIQGIKQVLGTLHDLDPMDIPEILSSLYMQYFSHDFNPDLVYKAFAKNVHYSISMDEFYQESDDEDDELVKKVESIQIYDFDNATFKLNMHRIMLYDDLTDTWTFNADLPKRFQRIARKYNKRYFMEFKRVLEELAEKYPMEEEERVISGNYFAKRGS